MNADFHAYHAGQGVIKRTKTFFKIKLLHCVLGYFFKSIPVSMQFLGVGLFDRASSS